MSADNQLGNGQSPQLATNDPRAMPIVGQAYIHRAGFWTEMGVCNCEAQTPLLLVANLISQCPSCKRKWQVGKVEHDMKQGRLNVEMTLVVGG